MSGPPLRAKLGRDRSHGERNGAAGDGGARRGRWLWRRRHAAGAFVALFALWELAAWLFALPPYLLPPPSKILVDLSSRWPRVLDGAWVTTSEIVVGYVLGVLVSIPLALLIAFSPTVQATLYPLLVLFQIIPKIAVAPLLIVWFGFGFLPKIMLVFLLSFFPIVISAIAGFRSLEGDVVDLARSTGAGAWKMFVKIRLPQSLPSIFTGLKVAAALAATAAVVAEFVGSDKGLGYLILEFNGFIEIPRVFACIVLLSAIGLALYYAVELIEHWTDPLARLAAGRRDRPRRQPEQGDHPMKRLAATLAILLLAGAWACRRPRLPRTRSPSASTGSSSASTPPSCSGRSAATTPRRRSTSRSTRAGAPGPR